MGDSDTDTSRVKSSTSRLTKTYEDRHRTFFVDETGTRLRVERGNLVVSIWSTTNGWLEVVRLGLSSLDEQDAAQIALNILN